MYTAATIPYHLRPLKAIERNLFTILLKKLDRYGKIDLSKYAYVGFGAPFFEDFKLMHNEFEIVKMDCIEYDNSAHTRQVFNNPYYFITLFYSTCTDYLNTAFNQDRNQIIWLDFASPNQLREQLQDIELAAAKLGNLDIIKVTLNVHSASYGCRDSYDKFLKLLNNDPVYQIYLPEKITTKELVDNFPSVIRAMGLRAIKRGLATAGHDLNFHHLASFDYADGQKMTTMTGIIADDNEFNLILKGTRIDRWYFYSKIPASELLITHEIFAPAMTILERRSIDRLMPGKKIKTVLNKLKFSLDDDVALHTKLIEGYCRYYKYLPNYSKITV
ncbi:MAG: O-methyltransferase [Ferruginibacter sp.]